MNRVWSRCSACDQLVRVIPGAYKGDGRQQWYWPVAHDVDGRPCEGTRRPI